LEAGSETYQWLDLQHATIQGKIRPGQSLAALAVLEQEVRRMREHGPTVAELTSTIATFTSQYEEAVAKAANRTNANLASMVYRAAKLDLAILSPAQERDLMVPVLAKASPTEVLAAFRAGWDHGNLLVAVTGADDLGVDGERSVRAALKASQAVPVTAPAQTAVATWAYGNRPAVEALSASAEAERKRKIDVFAKRGIHLDVVGPIDVVVKRTTFKPNEVLIQARLRLPLDARPAGYSELVSRAFLAGGLGRHAAEDLSEVLAGTSARLAPPRFDDDAVVFSAGCLPKDLETCIQRLWAQVSDPGWRSDAETRAKAEWHDELVAVASNLDQQVARRFQTLAVHDEPHRRPATLEEAEATSFAAVRPWFERILATAPMQLTIVGDIDEDATLALVRPYLGTLGAKRQASEAHLGAPSELTLARTQAIPAGVHRFAVPGTVRRALLRIAWPTSDYYDVGRTRRLGMLAQVIDERMRVRIREELGDAYSPFAYRFASEVYADYGYLIAQVGVAPEKAEEARNAVLEITRDLASKGVDAELLERVRAPVIKSIGVQRQQNQYWLGSVYDRAATQPFRVEWANSMESDYTSITAAELSALAKQFLDNEKALQVIAVCEGK
jgi:zinc protease